MFDRVQEQVSGVITVMKDNINRVLDRGDKLEDLQEKSGIDGLLLSACQVLINLYVQFISEQLQI